MDDVDSSNCNNISLRRSLSSCSSKCKLVGNGNPRPMHLWRPASLVNLRGITKNDKSPALEAIPSIENVEEASQVTQGALVPVNTLKPLPPALVREVSKRGWSTIVTVVLVEAKDLPDHLPDTHGLFCKIRLGSESVKSKSVPSKPRVEWRERFKLRLNKDHLLQISLWDKGRQKNFMGSCSLDLSSLEKERTHEVWVDLDEEFGSVHLSVTMCTIRCKNNLQQTDSQDESDIVLDEVREKYAFYNLQDWRSVGQLYVKVIGAKGLSGRPSAYCTLELDNERVETPSCKATTEPEWNKQYVFNVFDVTSTLEVRIHDSGLVSPLKIDSIGKVSIPLLRVSNGEMRWYALKDRHKRNAAKGNSPRVLIEMTLIYNPVKAAARLFQPREIKYIAKKPSKFDIALIYSNLEFMRDIFKFLFDLNEQFKLFMEWENKELCFVTLVGWLIFWFLFQPWMGPLLLLIPFTFFWVDRKNQQDKLLVSLQKPSDATQNEIEPKSFSFSHLTGRMMGLPDMTLTITGGVDYTVSLTERLYNLITFKVPFLSYLTMLGLVGMSFVIHFIPINYIMMAFGLYKFGRKYFNPERACNNDLLDFISRIPDNEILRDWKELSVPEPVLKKNSIKSDSARF